MAILPRKQANQITADTLTNPNWLVPSTPGQVQRNHGDSLLDQHSFIIALSTVSRHSWNIVMNPVTAEGAL